MTTGLATPTEIPTPAADAGYTAGQKDARRHRRRGFMIVDLPGLTAYAADAALLNLSSAERNYEALTAGFAEAYVRGYRAIARW